MTSAFRQSNGIIQGQLLNDKIDQTQSNVLAELSEIEKLTVKPHIVPTWADPFIDGQDGDAAAFAALSNHPEVPGVKLNAKGKPCYYTKIRGSKPIPIFVGSVEGLEDVDFDSLQEIEDQEGPNGEKVFAVDGRSWIRFYGHEQHIYDSNGNRLYFDPTKGYQIEVSSYFDTLLFKGYSSINNNRFLYSINGGTEQEIDNRTTTTIAPLGGRFADPTSILPNFINTSCGLNTIEIKPFNTTESYWNGFGIKLGTSTGKELLYPQKCVAQGKVFQVGYGEEESLPNVWEENYGQPGYNGEYDDFQDWGIGESVIHAVTNHTSGASQFMSQPLNIYEWIVNTSEGNAYRLLNPFLASGIHQATTGTHCNWSDPKPYVNLPVTGQEVIAGQLYYSATYSKLYKCIVNGTLNYVNQNDIEASGLFAHEIPINGGVTAWVTYDSVISPANRARVTRWINKKARHIGNTDIDERANGQQRPVFEAGEVDFSKHELMQVLHWRQFGNGDQNGDTATGFDTAPLVGMQNRAYVLDDGLTSLVGSGIQPLGAGCVMPDHSDDYWVSTQFASGLKLRSWDGAKEVLWGIASEIPVGTSTLKATRQDTTGNKIILNNSEIFTDVGGIRNLVEIHLYQIKLPDLPEDCCILSKKMIMAEPISPTEAGNLVTGKGVRRCYATKDTFYDQSVSSGINWYYNLGVLYPGGGCLSSGNTDREATLSQVFFGNELAIRLHDSTNQASSLIKIDNQILNSANFPNVTVNPLTGTFDISTGIWTPSGVYEAGSGVVLSGLNETIHKLEIVTLTSTAKYIDFCAIDYQPKTHRYFHYKTTQHPYVQPEFLGGGDGIDSDDLVVSLDGEMKYGDLKRPFRIELLPRWSLGLTSGQRPADGLVPYNFVRGEMDAFKAEVYNCNYFAATGEIIIVKSGIYIISINNLLSSQSGGGHASIHLFVNGNNVSNSYTYSESRPSEHNSMHVSKMLTLHKGDKISIEFNTTGPDLYGAWAHHANFNGVLIKN